MNPDTPASFLETMTIEGEKLSNLLSGDPWTNAEAAYKLLELSSYFIYGPLRNLDYYQLVETALKKRYMALMTGIAPESQQDKDIEGVSMLRALMFFRDLGLEAKNITGAIDDAWQYAAAKGELDTKTNKGVMMLLEQAKEGNELAKVAVDLLKEAYHHREQS